MVVCEGFESCWCTWTRDAASENRATTECACLQQEAGGLMVQDR